MKQRVKLAPGIVHDPVVVPLGRTHRRAGPRRQGRDAGADSTHRSRFRISVILSSHLMGDVDRTCDQIIVLENGRLVEEGAVSGVYGGEPDHRHRG